MKINFRSNPFAIFFIFFLFINNSNGFANTNSVLYTSLGLSNSFAVNPFNPNRLFIQSCLSLESFTESNDNWFYPDIGFGYKVSKNLAITGSIYGYNSGDLSYQKIAAGFQYFFGSSDTLNWVSSLKRVSYKSIKNYHMNNLIFDICKWVQYKSMFFRFGSGASFYKKVNYSFQPIRQKGQVNFILISSILPLKIFRIGIETRINSNKFFYLLFFQKDFF